MLRHRPHRRTGGGGAGALELNPLAAGRRFMAFNLAAARPDDVGELLAWLGPRSRAVAYWVSIPRSLMIFPQNAFCSFMNTENSSGESLVIC